MKEHERKQDRYWLGIVIGLILIFGGMALPLLVGK